jgi:hypothetical protein
LKGSSYNPINPLVWSASIVAGVLAAGHFVFEIERLSMFGRLHGITARIGLGFVVIHLVQHWKQIASYFGIKTKACQGLSDKGRSL